MALRRVGYKLLEAADGTEALEVAGRYGGPIDLLVADAALPLLSGRALAERLAPARPKMAVLYVVGTDDSWARQVLPTSTADILEKPFTPDALARKAWGARETGDPPWTDDQVAEAVSLLSELATDFEAQGQVRATWPEHLVATPPPARGIRRGRRGRT